jgi:hypothetical protein
MPGTPTIPRIFQPPKGWHAPPPLFNAQDKRDMRDTNYVLDQPLRLHVALFEVRPTKHGSVSFSKWISTAESILRPHNIALDIYPANKVPMEINHTLDGGGLYSGEQAADIRRLAHRIYDDQASPMRLPIIVADYHGGLQAMAEGFTQVAFANKPDGKIVLHDGTTWLPFVIIDSANAQPTGHSTVFLHEICHCAMVQHESAADPKNVMLAADQGITGTVNKLQIRQLTRCYFAQPKLTVK